jgi:two-component system, sensor histidine kinase and response regulator
MFAKKVNHEVRNPLNVIKGLTDYTLDMLKNIHQEQSPQRDRVSVDKTTLDTAVSDLSVILSTCNFLEHVVSDVLVIQRLETNMLTLNPSLCSMSEVMRELKDSLHQKADEASFIKMTYEFDPECKFVVDPFRLKQILLNYATNALKYTDKGEVVITSCAKDSDTAIVFSVRDTGRGIQESDRPKIFKAFTQLKASDAARHSSQGLGLHLVAMLADRMNATVGYTSIENVGSTFWLRIPYEK